MADATQKLDLARLVGDHQDVLYRYAFRLTGAAADAEDLTQQTFLAAQQKLDQLRSVECVRSWLFTVLRNCHFKGFRKRTPLLATSLELDLDALPEKLADVPIDSDALQRAIGSLPDDFKLVVMLFYFEQRSYREMAEILNVPSGTIMSRLSRAKACLRQALADTQILEPDRSFAQAARGELADRVLRPPIRPSVAHRSSPEEPAHVET